MRLQSLHCAANKVHQQAYNTTEAELDAATTLSKHVLWLHIYMEDISIPYHDAIAIREDNSAAQIIAHAGKLLNAPCTSYCYKNRGLARKCLTWESRFYPGLICFQLSQTL